MCRRLSPSLPERRRGVQLPNGRSLDQSHLWQNKMPVAGATNGSCYGIPTIDRLNFFWFQESTFQVRQADFFLKFSYPGHRVTTVTPNHYNIINATQSKSQDACNAQNSHNKQTNASLTKSDNIYTIISVQTALHISLQNKLRIYRANRNKSKQQHILLKPNML